jgi:hypothetical protein
MNILDDRAEMHCEIRAYFNGRYVNYHLENFMQWNVDINIINEELYIAREYSVEKEKNTSTYKHGWEKIVKVTPYKISKLLNKLIYEW